MSVRPALRGLSLAMLLASLSLLAACGFHLRGQVHLPPQMQRTYITGVSPHSAFARALAEGLRANGVQVVSREGRATAVLKVESLNTTRSVLSVNSDGTASDYLLVTQLAYSVRAATGTWKIPIRHLETQRHYSYSDAQVLGKSDEAAQLRDSMDRDLASLVLLQLQAAARR